MAEWSVSDELDKQVRSHLSDHGDWGFSDFIDKAVRRQILRDTIRDIRERNADLDPQLIEEEVNRAVEEARADRS